MAEESDNATKLEDNTDTDMESKIQTAMRSRVSHFNQQSDSLTLEGVRRLLEKDLGLPEFSLDVHKRFIKQFLVECLEGVGDDDATKMSGETGENGASTQETEGPKEEGQSKDVEALHPEDDEKMEEDSPVLGLLKEKKGAKLETKEVKGNGRKVVPSETLIKKAIRKRSSYIKANAEKVTMAGLRRLLEEDLQLDKFTLDPYKKLISQQLDEVLASSEVLGSANNAKKIVKKKPDPKITKRISSEENPNTSDSDEESDNKEEKQEDEIKARKKSVPKGKKQTSVGPKKRKGEETNQSSRKRAKPAKEASEDDSDEDDDGKNSEDDRSHSSPEKPAKKKEVSTAVYGKRVEHLKSVIKACGMSVPPVIYKKVKQVPENRREGQLIKELEEILSREGLSSNPSEKEIKEVKRRKAREKELEGIDLSNIVSSSRRRSTASFAAPPPPKPKVPVKTDANDAEESVNKKNAEESDNKKNAEESGNKKNAEESGNKKNDEGNDDEEDDEDEEEEEEEEEDSSDDDDDGSQSEEFNEDEEDSD